MAIHKSTVGAPLATVSGKNLTETYCSGESPQDYGQSPFGNKIEPEPCDDFYEFACQNWQRVNPNLTNAYDKLEKEEMELVLGRLI